VIYPLAWTVLTVIRGALDGWYPYPFGDPANGGYGAVVTTTVGIVVGFFVIALAGRAPR
jgi:hypothetical protein